VNINSWAEIVESFHEHWWLYLSMPFIAALIGYVTKIVAIKMMFYPLEFKGFPPYLGWQGIVPRRAARMASIATDTMTGDLISVDEIVGRLDPERIARELETSMLAAMENITREVMASYQPGLWEILPERVRALVVRQVQAEAPHMVTEVMGEIRRDIDVVLDLKQMIVTNLVRDKALLNKIFQEAGAKEFQFIARSGIFFGFAIGLVQMVAWALTENPWVLPLFGLFTGWFSDWIALKMVFEPYEEKRYGPFKWQGLFLKRRHEVAGMYGELIATEIITPANIFEAVLRGPLSDRVFTMVQKQVQKVMDAQAGIAKPLVVLAVGGRRYQAMKQEVAERVMELLPEQMHQVEAYAEDAMDIRNTLVERMRSLTPTQFAGLLRPAFEQDEWILIAVGAALGFLVGELQVFLLLH
jgi:uncharacterized membrane protein YheB (UPF0754 family)